jgi:heme-degrading monooxygenase HmoA
MSGDGDEFVILWEFRVRKGCEATFEDAYGPGGAWGKLFASGVGFVGTELIRDLDHPRRYITIDRWASRDAYATFKESNASAYAEFDEQCERWTKAEAKLGTWTVVGPQNR